MEKKSIFKIISNFAVVGALVTSLSVPAFAAPPLQESGDQGDQNQSGQQDNNGDQGGDNGQSGDANQGGGNNQSGDQNQGDGNSQGNGSDQGTGQGAGANQGTGANQGVEANQGTGTGLNQTTNAMACAQTYTVQQGDSLSAIAGRFYNDVQGFNTIVQATNNAVGTGGNFTNISDPNVIVPGQTLCIPASTNAGAMANTGAGMNAGGTAGTGAAQGAIPAAITTSGNNANMTAQQASFLANNTQQGMLIVENMSGGDMIFDLTQPSLGSVWIGPNQQGQFVIDAGEQQYNAHHPTGEFSVAPGTIQVTAGQITRMSCSTNMCQIVPSFQSGQQQQSGQMQQQGQQPGQMQQQNQQPGQMQQGQQQQGQTQGQGNNGGNDNGGDNNGSDDNNGDNGGDNNNNNNSGANNGGNGGDNNNNGGGNGG